MYNYDYRPYFNDITGKLDDIYSKQGETYTEIHQMHTDINEKLDSMQSTISTYGIMISAILVIVCLFGVLKG